METVGSTESVARGLAEKVMEGEKLPDTVDECEREAERVNTEGLAVTDGSGD